MHKISRLLGTKIEFTYTNYKGEISKRLVEVYDTVWGSTEYHPEPQFLLVGLDLHKDALRIFAINDIKELKVIDTP